MLYPSFPVSDLGLCSHTEWHVIWLPLFLLFSWAWVGVLNKNQMEQQSIKCE